jgi:uncharacterized protein YdaU (DUF1376 family)
MKPPAFQFYARDWLSSTLGMPWDVAGVYIHLLAWSWDNGPLPNDPKWRARIIGADAQRLWTALKPRWNRTKKGYINPRLEHQREQQATFRARSEKGAAARWQASRKQMPKRSSASASASASSSLDQNTPAAQRPVSALTFKTYVAIASRVLKQTADLDLDGGTLAEELKREYAKARIPYDATVVAKAIEAAQHGRVRRRA